MFETRVSRALLLLGLGVGVMSVVVWALDVRLNPPDWMIRIAFIKLALLASAGLLAAGAMVGRHARERGDLSKGPDVPRVGEGAAAPLEQFRDAGSSEIIERRRPDSGR